MRLILNIQIKVNESLKKSTEFSLLKAMVAQRKSSAYRCHSSPAVGVGRIFFTNGIEHVMEFIRDPSTSSRFAGLRSG